MYYVLSEQIKDQNAFNYTFCTNGAKYDKMTKVVKQKVQNGTRKHNNTTKLNKGTSRLSTAKGYITI